MFRRALFDSFVKLNPWSMARNPVMFVVEVGSVLNFGVMDSSTARYRRGAGVVYRFRITLVVVYGSLRKLF